MPAREPSAAFSRDRRLDMFRGLALVMIFINHVPGTLYESFTSRNFGFSDAAEGFVLMSGIAAGLAYTTRFRTSPFWHATMRVWARARTLYLVHLLMTLCAYAAVAIAVQQFDLFTFVGNHNIDPIFSQPLSTMLGLPLLLHQLGYFDMLPLYVALMLAVPALLPLGLRMPMLLLFASAATWVVASQLRINFPTFPSPGGWFFNPLCWQLIFVIGLLAGIGTRIGKPLVPYNRVLFWISSIFLVVALFWSRNASIGAAGMGVLSFFDGLGVPAYFIWFDKPYMSLPRLLHALALAYVFANMASIRDLADSWAGAPLVVLGRHSLPVFATSAVIAWVLQMVKLVVGSEPLMDALLVGSGIVFMLALAYTLDWLAQEPKDRQVAPVPASEALPVKSTAGT